MYHSNEREQYWFCWYFWILFLKVIQKLNTHPYLPSKQKLYRKKLMCLCKFVVTWNTYCLQLDTVCRLSSLHHHPRKILQYKVTQLTVPSTFRFVARYFCEAKLLKWSKKSVNLVPGNNDVNTTCKLHFTIFWKDNGESFTWHLADTQPFPLWNRNSLFLHFGFEQIKNLWGVN